VYNDLSNQKVATTFSFINLHKLDLHVAGDKFAHPQEPFCLYLQHLVQCTDSEAEQQSRYIVPKAVNTVKMAPEDGRICRPKHVGLI